MVSATTAASGATAPPPKRYANCAALNKDYPHGVGIPGARDKVRTGQPRVTTFTRSVKVYRLNAPRLDRDRDGIACERR